VYEEAPPLVSGTGYTTPDLSPRRASATMAAIRGVTGVPTITAAAAAALASKMQLGATPSADGASIDVLVPPTRPDVLHECDIVEDVAIAYGYNNLPTALPTTQASGAQLPINKLTDALRHELARAGYDECLTFALVSREDNYGSMLLPDPTAPLAAPGTPSAAAAAAPAPPGSAVVLANPKTEEFQIGRTALVPGLLKSLASNRAASLRDGLKLFEVSDVMLVDPSTDTGARNERRAAALYTGPTAGYEVIHGLVDRLMMLLEVPRRAFAWERAAASGDASPAVATSPDGFGRGGLRYYVEPEPGVPSYFPGRGARVVVESRAGGSVVAGTFGVLHPRVLAAFELAFPVSVVELNVEHFL
jgi:phenylalanyl-tRNA synthetase beta chain